MIYLLHYDRPIGTRGRGSATHYLGWCEDRDLARRLEQHATGTAGVKITDAFYRAGATPTLAAMLPGGTRDQERLYKRAGNFRRHCPLCKVTVPMAPAGGYRVALLRTPTLSLLPLLRRQMVSGGASRRRSLTGSASNGTSPRARR